MTLVKVQRKLRLRIKQMIEDSLSVPTRVIIVYDSSGSIQPYDFDKEKQCGRRIISSFPPRVKIAAMHFSSTTAIIAGFDAPRDRLLASNDAAVRFGGGTATHLALDEASRLLQTASASADPAERKLVVLFTDGCPDSQYDTERAAKRLRDTGCELIGIGLGSLNANALIQCVGQDHFFLMDSWESLAKALDLTPNSTRSIVSESEVSIEATQLQVPVRLDDPIPLKLTIRNVGMSTITPGTILKLSDKSQYYTSVVHVFESQLGIGQNYEVEISLAPQGRPKAEDLPELVEWTLQDPASGKFYFVTSEGFEVQTHNMFGEFLAWRPVSHVREVANICLFGWAGAGKSRLNNALLSIFSETQPRVAEEFGAADHVTKELSAYTVADSITDGGGEGPDLKFQFWDTYGLSQETYKKIEEFDALVDGALPLGWSRTDKRPIPTTKSVANRKDAIIFVVPQGSVNNQEVMKLTRSFAERAVRDRRMAPIAVITHADELEPEDWEPIRLKAKEALGLQNEVFIIDNSEKMTKTFKRDKTLYLILRSVLQSAQERIKAEDGRDMQQMLPK